MATETAANGRATLRDVLDLQRETHKQQNEIRDEMHKGFTELKVQNAKNSAIVALIVSFLMSVLVGVVIANLTGALK